MPEQRGAGQGNLRHGQAPPDAGGTQHAHGFVDQLADARGKRPVGNASTHAQIAGDFLDRHRHASPELLIFSSRADAAATSAAVFDPAVASASPSPCTLTRTVTTGACATPLIRVTS